LFSNEWSSYGPREKTTDWHDILSSSITTSDELAKYLPVKISEIEKVIQTYPMKINPYYLSMIKKKGDALWRQAVPDFREIERQSGDNDPLSEESQSPVTNLICRYPDRVLFIVSDQCAMYCRFCMRKRKIGGKSSVTDDTIQQGIEYIKQHKNIREVILSGGDPLLLGDETITGIMKQLREISHVDMLRIHTRVPCTLPQRVTENLVLLLKQFHPVYINTHFNHPDEITPDAATACMRLADAGIPMGCQTVLLKGVNNTPTVMKRLMRQLLKIRVKPYYIHQMDLVFGTAHFRTPIHNALTIMKTLRGNISGTGVPQYMIDLPGGYGKIPLIPEYLPRKNGRNLLLESYTGEMVNYPDIKLS